MTVNTIVDWETIERDYRAGIKSIRQIAKEQGITHRAIQKRAERDRWERDLAARIRVKADAVVARDAVATRTSPSKSATEREIIEANAELQANVIREHRAKLLKARRVLEALLDEMEFATANHEVIYTLAEDIARGEDGKPNHRQVEAFMRAVGLGGRVVTFEALTRALRNVITLEREAFGIKSDGGDDEPAMPLVIHDTYQPPEAA
ncbi:MAG: hypothetical protein AB7Q97_12445 [Gammaproteobacteria bacterium]